MTKQQLINELRAIGSEYMFRDIGYGGFYDNNDTFRCQGEVYSPTKAELQEMLDEAYRNLLGDEDDIKAMIDYILTK